MKVGGPPEESWLQKKVQWKTRKKKQKDENLL